MEQQRGLGVGEKLAALGALEIGEEDEAVRILPLQQHHAQIGHAVAVDGGERHRIGIVRLGGLRLGKPLREKRIRIRCCREVTVH